MDEISPGHIVVPKGGRPKATAKHLAVFMARLHYTEKLGKAYLADSELMALFGVSDPSVLRRMVTKASETAKRGVIVRSPDGWVIWVEGTANRATNLPVPLEGGACWVWCEGMREAQPSILRDVQHSLAWQQGYPSM